VLMEGPGQRVLFERTEAESESHHARASANSRTPTSSSSRGSSARRFPKIEVLSRRRRTKTAVRSAVHDPADWVAMVTDDRDLRAPFPCSGSATPPGS